MSDFAQSQLVVNAYNLCVLAGCAYLIAAHGWSGWWFLLAIGLCKSVSDGAKAGDA